MPRQWLRKARTSVGLPASKDVGIIGKMLSDIRSKVERQLGGQIDSAAVIIINLAALYKEDILDAFEYVGLHYFDIPVRYDVLYETNAAYAGYGYGLCSNYVDRVACKQEQDDMPSDVVMAVLYTRTALTVSLSITKSAYYLYEPVHRLLVDFSLEFDVGHVVSSDTTYWDAVKLKFGQIMIENPYYERPSKVLLLGECVQELEILLVF